MNRILCRRGTDAERLLITPAAGEPIFCTDTKTFYVGDGTTVGGVAVGGASVASGSLSTVHLSGAGAIAIKEEHFAKMVHIESGTSGDLAKADFTKDGSLYIQNHSGATLPINFTGTYDGVYNAGNKEDLTGSQSVSLDYLEIMLVVITINGLNKYLNFVKFGSGSSTTPNWTASENVDINTIRVATVNIVSTDKTKNIKIGDLIRSTVKRTTGATFDATELGFWAEVSAQNEPKEVAKTANYTVLSSDNYTNFINTGATGLVNFTLGSATEGFKLSFAVTVAQELRVTGSINAGGSIITNLRSAILGNYLSLEVRNGIWTMVGMTGTWADA